MRSSFWRRVVTVLSTAVECGLIGLAFLAFGGGLKLAVAQQSCVGVAPATLAVKFPQLAVGTRSANVQDITISNNCTSVILPITSISFGPSEFQLVAGWTPVNLTYGEHMTFELRFAPDAAKTFTGNFTVNINGYSPVVVSLTGTGYLAGATASWNTTSLSFNSVPVGTTSAVQTATLTNLGPKSLTISGVSVDPPFSVSGFTSKFSLAPNHSLPLQVSFTPSLAGSFNGVLNVTTASLPPTGVTLYATAAAPASFAISSFPVLPAATAGYSYQATLQSAGGTGAVSWSLASGSSLPAGLSLSSSGTISGTVSSSVSVGTYPFTMAAMDSNTPPSTATLPMTLAVRAPTGSACNNTQWNVGTTTPLVPMTDLGTGTYLGTEGGLYMNGSNVMPAGHDADGLTFANAIQPLGADGNPDPNGHYVLISIGMSVTSDTFQVFMQDAAADPSINQHLVLVQGAQPRIGAQLWANLSYPSWADISDYFLPQSGVTANQVVAAWVEVVNGQPSGTFPRDITKLQANLESIAQDLHTFFPNLTLAFFSSREYGGYSNGIINDDPEPYAYESGFAVRGVIQDQINGVASMNYNPNNGPVKAPWVAWASYPWANGMLPRSDGFVWTCQDFQGDGVHPSLVGGGLEKNANMLMNFFKTTDVTAPWFLAH